MKLRFIKSILVLLALLASSLVLEKVSFAADKYYKITFDESFDGGKRTIFELKEGSDIKSKSYIPKRKGYKFKFWSTSKADSRQYSIDQFSYYPVRTDKTIYAQWIKDGKVDKQERYFKLTLNENYDGAKITTQDLEQNQPFNYKLYTPVFNGYEFKEWNTQADGKGVKYDKRHESIMKGDITLYAIWKGEKPKRDPKTRYYSVTIIESFKEGRTIQCFVKEGSNLVYKPYRGSYDRYTFLGMYKVENGKYIKLRNLASGTYEYKIESDVKLIAAFDKYEYIAPEPKEPKEPPMKYTELTLHYSDGSNETRKFHIMLGGNAPLKKFLNEIMPSKTNDVIGFVSEQNGDMIILDEIKISKKYVKNQSRTNKIDLYLKWKSEIKEEDYCKLNLDYNEPGKGDKTSKFNFLVKKNSKIKDQIKNYEPELDGFVFKGWNIGSSAGEELKDDTKITEETKLVARWESRYKDIQSNQSTPDNYTKTLTLNENYLHATITQWYGLEPNNSLSLYLHTPVRKGYRFIGWNSDPYAKGKTYTGEDILKSSLYLYAIWGKPQASAPAYTRLTLDENHAHGRVTHKDVMPGDAIEPHLYKPKRRGFTFKGWSYNKKHLDKVHYDDRIYEPTTIYAIWDELEEEPEEIKGLTHKAYIFGYPDGTVRPNGKITRAEAAAMLARLLEIESIGSADKPMFPDTESAWYNKAINASVQRGIMKGYPDGTFRPNEPITRAEFTQMIATIDNKAYGVAPFADVVGHWAERPIGSEYQAGRIMGYPDGTFRPDNHITRCEAAVILNKIFERNFDNMSLLKCKNPQMIKYFIDLDASFWGYNDMVEATNDHDFVRRSLNRVPEDWLLIK